MVTKRNCMLILFVVVFAVGMFANAGAQTEYTNMLSGEALELVRHNSALIGNENSWRSPLAAKYDGKKVQVSGCVTGKSVLPYGDLCLVMDYYKSEHIETNWYRREYFTVKIILDKNSMPYSDVKVGEYITAQGIINIDYIWNDNHIDKNDQKSMGILANFQGNGRGNHIYSFEVRNAKICNRK